MNYILNTEKALKVLRGIATGTTSVAAIYTRDLVRLKVPLPTKVEQEAIAEALSDTDTLIESLEQVIAKKRRLKQGAMQGLLTGKKRLPGFDGEWKVVNAGSIGRFKGGSGFPIAYQGNASGEYPFFKVSDMNNEGNETFMTTANNYISETVRMRLGAYAFPPKTIVFAKVTLPAHRLATDRRSQREMGAPRKNLITRRLSSPRRAPQPARRGRGDGRNRQNLPREGVPRRTEQTAGRECRRCRQYRAVRRSGC